MKIKLVVIAMFALVLVWGGFAPAAAQTVTITVTTTEDEVNEDGDCSLREAIIAANRDEAVDNCPAGNGADQIDIPAGHYILSIPHDGDHTDEGTEEKGDLDILDDLSILGAGPEETIIDANRLDRVIDIYPNNVVVSISNVTVTGGAPTSGFSGGGGIRLGFASELTLDSSHIVENVDEAGITAKAQSTLTIRNSHISSNVDRGLLISSFASVTILNSTISNNTMEGTLNHGGGIYTYSSLTIVNSTISGNSTEGGGGGLFLNGLHEEARFELYNVTITENMANTDGDQFSRGGGIRSSHDAHITISHSIISGNTQLDTPTPSPPNPDCDATLTSKGYNIIGDTRGCTIVGDTTGNLTDISAELGPLQDNGGPTFTHALLQNSPAIDAGNRNGCLDHEERPLTIDQRGYIRKGQCDIGAFEYRSPGPAPTSTPTKANTPMATSSATLTPTPTPTQTNTPASTTTQTNTPTATHNATQSPTSTPTQTNTPVSTTTQTNTPTATHNATQSPTPTETATGMPPTDVPTATPETPAEGTHAIFMPLVVR